MGTWPSVRLQELSAYGRCPLAEVRLYSRTRLRTYGYGFTLTYGKLFFGRMDRNFFTKFSKYSKDMLKNKFVFDYGKEMLYCQDIDVKSGSNYKMYKMLSKIGNNSTYIVVEHNFIPLYVLYKVPFLTKFYFGGIE